MEAVRAAAEIPGVVERIEWRGAAYAGGAPGLLLEVPHGATRTEDFRALEARLSGGFPADLIDFFYVNTDAGAPELAEAIARRYVAAHPERAARVLRCRIPRTFVDCNRLVEAQATGAITPGVPPYVRAEVDRALLAALHGAYVAEVERAAAEVCGAGGQMWMIHTYAPRSVDVAVDDRIVESLRAAYRPEQVGRWPLRPEIDLITRTPDGQEPGDPARAAALIAAAARAGRQVAVGETYPLHPVTQAYRFALAWPGRVLCAEVRRDLLADPFEPFAEMRISAAAAERVAEIFAAAF